MRDKIMPEAVSKIWEKVKTNKYVLLVVVVGLILILLPKRSNNASTKQVSADTGEFSLEQEEARMAKAMEEIDGVGKVSVVLTLKTGSESVVAVDTESSSTENDSEKRTDGSSSTVIMSEGSSVESPVTLKTIYPEYQGALVVAEGADSAEIKLRLTSAIAGLTGLSTEKITVVKMKNS